MNISFIWDVSSVSYFSITRSGAFGCSGARQIKSYLLSTAWWTECYIVYASMERRCDELQYKRQLIIILLQQHNSKQSKKYTILEVDDKCYSKI